MLRLRMVSDSDLRVLIKWFQDLTTSLMRRGILLFMHVDEISAPSYLDIQVDGCSEEQGVVILATKIERFVTSRWLYAYITKQITTDFDYLSSDECDYICTKVFKQALTLYEYQEESQRRLADDFMDVLYEYGEVNIDGVLHFRFAMWLTEVKDSIRSHIDNFLVEKEYEQFVGALRYYLDTTPMTKGIVHVVCHGDTVEGFDDKHEPLDIRLIEAIACDDDDDMHPEDVFMSALITRAPEGIIIHTMDATNSFVCTLQEVFRTRATLCKDPHCDYGSHALTRTV